MLCSTVAVTGALVTTAGAQDDAAAGFADGSTYRDVRVGDLAPEPYEIRMSNTQNATIVFTGARNTDFPYWMNVTLHDDDGDGVVYMNINTFEVGHTNPFIVESGSVLRYDMDQLDEGHILNTSTNQSQDAYDMFISAGTDPAATLQSYQHNARMMVDESETQGFDPATAPKALDVQRLGDIYEQPDVFSNLRPSVSAEMDHIVADGDQYMPNPWGDGYFGSYLHALEELDSDRPEDALLWLIENGYYNFSVRQLYTGNETAPKVLDVEKAVETGGLEFDANQSYKHLLLALDTDAKMFQQGGSGEYVDAQPGETYMVTYAKQKRADPDPHNTQLITTNFSVVRPSITIDSPVTSLQDDEFSGVSSLAPGTKMTLYVDTGSETTTVNATVEIRPGLRNDHPPAAGVYEIHPWNITVDLGDVDATEVQVTAWAEGYGKLGAYPPGVTIDNEPTTTPGSGPATTTPGDDDDPTTTDDTGDESTTTEASGDGGSGSGTDGGDGGSGTDGGDGGGGTIPGFTASLALIAVIAGALLSLRRA